MARRPRTPERNSVVTTTIVRLADLEEERREMPGKDMVSKSVRFQDEASGFFSTNVWDSSTREYYKLVAWIVRADERAGVGWYMIGTPFGILARPFHHTHLQPVQINADYRLRARAPQTFIAPEEAMRQQQAHDRSPRRVLRMRDPPCRCRCHLDEVELPNLRPSSVLVSSTKLRDTRSVSDRR